MINIEYVRVELPGVYVFWMMNDGANSVKRNPIYAAKTRMESMLTSGIGRRKRETIDPKNTERVNKFIEQALPVIRTLSITPFNVRHFTVSGYDKPITRYLNEQEVYEMAGKMKIATVQADRLAVEVRKFAKEEIEGEATFDGTRTMRELKENQDV